MKKQRITKNGHSRIVQCNGERLRNCIWSKIGMSPARVSIILGYNQSYLSSCINNNRIGIKAIKLLEQNFEISFEDYSINSNISNRGKFEFKKSDSKNKIHEKSSKNNIVFQVTIDADSLYTMIQKAVREEFKAL